MVDFMDEHSVVRMNEAIFATVTRSLDYRFTDGTGDIGHAICESNRR